MNSEMQEFLDTQYKILRSKSPQLVARLMRKFRISFREAEKLINQFTPSKEE